MMFFLEGIPSAEKRLAGSMRKIKTSGQEIKNC
jgi:hypothetical protein